MMYVCINILHLVHRMNDFVSMTGSEYIHLHPSYFGQERTKGH